LLRDFSISKKLRIHSSPGGFLKVGSRRLSFADFTAERAGGMVSLGAVQMKSKIMRIFTLIPKSPTAKTDDRPENESQNQAYEDWLNQQIRKRDRGRGMESRGNKMI
jgi:hypothetical protein